MIWSTTLELLAKLAGEGGVEIVFVTAVGRIETFLKESLEIPRNANSFSILHACNLYIICSVTPTPLNIKLSLAQVNHPALSFISICLHFEHA